MPVFFFHILLVFLYMLGSGVFTKHYEKQCEDGLSKYSRYAHYFEAYFFSL